jgi:hypothetical protein
MDDVAMNWFRLHERRGSLIAHSLLAEAPARKKTFAAAMTQFEEQMTAARVVSPATRPLNLYYGLAQAGMAVAAAHATGHWSFSSHGLKLLDTTPELGDIRVAPSGSGAFQKVAAATGSPEITSPVSLGALWASLPELRMVAPIPGTPRPIALDALSPSFTGNAPRLTVYLPSQMLPGEGPQSAAWRERFGEIMADYPSAQGYLGIPVEPHAVVAPEDSTWQWSVDLGWPFPDPGQEWTRQRQEEFANRVAPEYRHANDRYLRPSVEGDGKPPPSPLMTWWLLLFSFSILARYQPRKWVSLLDLDQPGCAAALQIALEEALSAVPHLVLEALDGESMLLRRPLAV